MKLSKKTLEEIFYNKELSDAIRDIVVNSPTTLVNAAMYLKYSKDYERDVVVIKKLSAVGLSFDRILVVIKGLNLDTIDQVKEAIDEIKSMGSFQEKMKVMPRVSAEAGEYVVIETTINGVVISEVAVCITELGWSIHNGIKCSNVELSAFNENWDGIPLLTKITF